MEPRGILVSVAAVLLVVGIIAITTSSEHSASVQSTHQASSTQLQASGCNTSAMFPVADRTLECINEMVQPMPPKSIDCCGTSGGRFASDVPFVKLPIPVSELMHGMPNQLNLEFPEGSYNKDGAISWATVQPVEGETIHMRNLSASDVVYYPDADPEKCWKEGRFDPMFTQDTSVPEGAAFPFEALADYADSIPAKFTTEWFMSPLLIAAYGKEAEEAGRSKYEKAFFGRSRSATAYVPATFDPTTMEAKVLIALDCYNSIPEGMVTKQSSLPMGTNWLSSPPEGSLAPNGLKYLVDNMIAKGRLPKDIVLICDASTLSGMNPADQDLRAPELGRANDALARFYVEQVLPAAAKEIQKKMPRFKFSEDRKDRGMTGCSNSGGATTAAVFFGNELFHRGAAFSPMQAPLEFGDEEAPLGMAELSLHKNLILNSARKPMRLYQTVGSADAYSITSIFGPYDAIMPSVNDWYVNNGYWNIPLLANRSAHAFNTRYGTDSYKFEYAFEDGGEPCGGSQFCGAQKPQGGAAHCDWRVTKGPAFVEAMEWMWQD